MRAAIRGMMGQIRGCWSLGGTFEAAGMKEAGDDSLLDRICLTLVRLGVLSEDVQGRPFTELPTGWAVKGGSVRPHSSIIAISNSMIGSLVLDRSSFVARPRAAAQTSAIRPSGARRLRRPPRRLATAHGASVKGGVIMDRRGGGERPGVALQNCTTRRLP